MWLYLIYGFFSIACAKSDDGITNDPNVIMIRVRIREHLENLKARFPDLLGKAKIVHSDDTDYAWRIIVPKSVWISVISQVVEEQTWSNYKSEVAKNKSHLKSGFEKALHRVWAIMYDLQSVQSIASGSKTRIAPVGLKPRG